MSRCYEEIRVYEGIAERTGNRVEGLSAGTRITLCNSVAQLGASSRRLGDGLYYLVATVWPDQTDTIDLNRSWTSLG